MNDRVDRLREALGESELDGLWVGSSVADGAHAANRRYLTGFTGTTGFVLVTRDRALLVVDGRYTRQAELQAAPSGFEVLEVDRPLAEWLIAASERAELAGKRIGISEGDTTLGAYLRLETAVEEADANVRPRIEPASGLVETLRRVKDADELASLQRAIDVADTVCARVIERLEPGMTEVQIADAIADGVRREGAEGVSFPSIVARGTWAASPHAYPREVALSAGDVVVIDMGALVDGYCSDLTRTVMVGGADGRFRGVYERVNEAQAAVIAGVEPGMGGKTAHDLAEDVFKRYGVEQQFVHGLGHGVGLDIHEYPFMGRNSRDTLGEGMVFTIEPGLYDPDWGGVRIEDIVVLEASGARVLSNAPKLHFA